MALTYIVVSGNSGAGKSTLIKSIAKELLSKGDRLLTTCDERQFHHPFLRNMFEDPARWALPIQLNFMTQRACCVMEAARSAQPGSVLLMERCLWEDRLFFAYYVRQGKIKPDIQPAYEQLHKALISATPRPDLMIHLRGRTESLYGRLEAAYAKRDRDVELLGDALRRYLDGMNAFYDEWRTQVRTVPAQYLEYDIDAPDYDPVAIVSRVVSLVP